MPGTQRPTLPTRDFDALYEDLDLISLTGLSEVRRVRDRVLYRNMVAKFLAKDLVDDAASRDRFVLEAQVTAGLQHTGIVPVHELAQTPEGRPYFTMKEIEGRTLTQLALAVHAESRGDTFGTTDDGWNFRRLIDVLRRASDAVAYAHLNGVLHRDLKPDNVMASAYGEVSVVDWGLAKIDATTPSFSPRLADRPELTVVGEVSGTATYMSPEQALGRLEQIGPASDVYCLGTTLYMVLCGEPPYQGEGWEDVWRQVVRGPPKPLSARGAAPRIPAELVRICERSMARTPALRYPDAGAFRDEIGEWLDGVRRRDQALERVRVADRRHIDATTRRDQAEQLRRGAQSALLVLPPGAEVEEKLPAWRLEDEATEVEREAALAEVEELRLLTEALSLVPELREGRERMARIYRGEHEQAERARDHAKAARFEALLRQFDTGICASYLAGKAAFSLYCEPEASRVELFEIVEIERRLVPQHRRDLGPTPLREVEIHAGSWLLKIQREGYRDVLYPLYLRREEHWDGVPVGEASPRPVRLLRDSELGPDDIYVPGGWTLLGPPPGQRARNALQDDRRWLEPFIIRRFPVTFGEYAEFLTALHRAGRGAEAVQCTPRGGAGFSHGDNTERSSIQLDSSGVYRIGPDADGDLMLPEYPICRVDFARARAYAAWMAESTGQPWRLPAATEWEKAARGVDGRAFPWGDHLEPIWFNNKEFRRQGLRPFICGVDSFPIDVSVYGVRGLAGNATDWCEDLLSNAEIVGVVGNAPATNSPTRYKLRVRKGGAFNLRPEAALAYVNEGVNEHFVSDGLTIRIARGL